MEKVKLELIIERAEHDLSGRVNYNGNLIVDNAATVEELETKLKNLLYDFENLDPEMVIFERVFDVYALFKEFDFLNISKIAERAGINASLLRQYASQVKYPSAAQAKKIEETIHLLAGKMLNMHVSA